ncbi:MAG: DUF3303 family protein [Polyangiales bacterium]
MRYVVKLTLPVEKFNQAVRDGTVGEKIQSILEDSNPEAAYFTARDGSRGGYLIINMENASEIPKYAEPWFLHFDAEVEFLPAMTPQDLQEAGLEALGKRWG